LLPNAAEGSNGAEKATGNGHAAEIPAPTPEKAATATPVVSAPAAVMPQTAAIPDERRKPRLLDRITSLAKN
jgi:hypothetical protein